MRSLYSASSEYLNLTHPPPLSEGVLQATGRELKSYVTLAISIAGVAVSLGINPFLGVLMLFTVLKLLKLSLKEALVVAFTAEFGFLLGMVVIMFILITAGTMFGIKELEFNMTWEEIFRLAMSP